MIELNYLPSGDAARPLHARDPAGGNLRLRLLTYNIQVGIASRRYHHYLTHSWKHVLPHAESLSNLERIAQVIHSYDIVALQEADAGSFRSLYVNQIEFIAQRASFPYWYSQTNRNLGKLAQHSNGLLSRRKPLCVHEHKLPGIIPGRGLLEVHYGRANETPLVLLLVHLALSKRARLRQIAYIIRLVNRYEHVMVMGDFNCQAQSDEMALLHEHTRLCRPVDELPTFPSWRPHRNIDHILATPEIRIDEAQVLPHTVSDHLPITVDITLPSHLTFDSHEPRALKS
ncbi:MAG: endonuclease/exonuclease/phosphatase family protein [Gammaproteobacteria bacterium]|nr:endonuclease/exonuclease/phosphatase family protein [Gammaproteobacteria bacterium]